MLRRYVERDRREVLLLPAATRVCHHRDVAARLRRSAGWRQDIARVGEATTSATQADSHQDHYQHEPEPAQELAPRSLSLPRQGQSETHKYEYRHCQRRIQATGATV